jgi:aspartyl-tRNA(Asn)/glutamyl-tRNA(Gln) amidotransferase subunit A
MKSPIHELDAASLAEHYRSKTLSPVEVTQAVLERIDAWEPHIRATWALDPEQALAMARTAQARWLRGAPLGPLDGVPVTIKENFATRGMPVPLGSAATPLIPATEDSPPVARMREAGAIFLCKTTMPDFGMLAAAHSSFHPLTRNPWDRSRNTGGSSSGAGAAAAAGYGPLHLGSDIGGSVRIPASLCGVFGFKPSLGRIPIDPPYIGRVAGPMTRTVTDAALMMGALSLPDARDHMSLPYQDIPWSSLAGGLKGLRIGLWLDPGNEVHVDPEVRAAIGHAASCFEAAGAHVEPLRPWVRRGTLEHVSRFWGARMRSELGALPEERRARASAIVRQLADSTAGATGKEIYNAHAEMFALRAATVAATRDYDFIISPTFPQPAFGAHDTHVYQEGLSPIEHAIFTIVFNFSEQPAASINCGYTANGLPIGLQIAGRRFDDLGVLRVARAWETLRPEQRTWPEPPSGHA